MDRHLPLVMLLGDSIRIGYQAVVQRELTGRAEIWWPDENGAHTAHTLARLDTWLDGRQPAVIHLNCGLHDLWREPDDQLRHSEAVYATNLAAVLDRLRQTAAVVVFALTTPVDQTRQVTSNYGRIVRYDADVPRYNDLARRLCEARGVVVNDLYGVVEQAGRDGLIGADGVHYSPAGCEVLGRAVAACVAAHLPA